MTADDVGACLSLRWPDSEYLHVDEAPQEPSRGGRKIDRLVVTLWPSRGLALDGVEIKVSLHDWRRELKQAAKADWWWQHVNRFWIAVPAEMAEKVREELPPTWGLLSCVAGERPKVVVDAPHHDAAPMPWSATVGILRAAADCGVNALWRAEAKGREIGRKDAEQAFERRDPDNVVRAELQRLRERLSAFEQASGLDLTRQWEDATELGHLVAIFRKECPRPGWTLEAVSHAVGRVRDLANAANELEKLGLTIERLATNGTQATEGD